MITIIHGENLSLSRSFLLDKKNEAKEVVEFSGGRLQLSDLAQLSTGGSLFTRERSVFIENLLVNKKQTAFKEIVEFIKINQKDFDFFLWENGELSKTILSQFPGASVNVFKLPQNLFLFLDNLRPDNQNNVNFFHKAIENSNQELVLYMMIRQFRLMLALVAEDLLIDEVKRIAPWQKDKVRKQANLFGEEKLIRSLKKLHIIDLKQKSGQTGLTLIQAVDIFLLSV